MKSSAGIGMGDDGLIGHAADVTCTERRRLVLVPNELRSVQFISITDGRAVQRCVGGHVVESEGGE